MVVYWHYGRCRHGGSSATLCSTSGTPVYTICRLVWAIFYHLMSFWTATQSSVSVKGVVGGTKASRVDTVVETWVASHQMLNVCRAPRCLDRSMTVRQWKCLISMLPNQIIWDEVDPIFFGFADCPGIVRLESLQTVKTMIVWRHCGQYSLCACSLISSRTWTAVVW